MKYLILLFFLQAQEPVLTIQTNTFQSNLCSSQKFVMLATFDFYEDGTVRMTHHRTEGNITFWFDPESDVNMYHRYFERSTRDPLVLTYSQTEVSILSMGSTFVYEVKKDGYRKRRVDP